MPLSLRQLYGWRATKVDMRHPTLQCMDGFDLDHCGASEISEFPRLLCLTVLYFVVPGT